jgi:hypothetical protein|tara:strand:+ start:341 stop:853 length:513 start_codon:yes stop_codon:yes gene_type:complete
MTNEQQPIITTAVPIRPQIQVVQGQVVQGQGATEPPLNIKLTYAYAKSVKLFASIEAFFLILYGFYQPWFFIQAIGPIIGYYGAKQFNKPLAYVYFTYLILALLSKFIVLALTPIINGTAFYIALSILTIVIDIWILKISATFIHYLHDLTSDELNNLRHLRIVTTYLYW